MSLASTSRSRVNRSGDACSMRQSIAPQVRSICGSLGRIRRSRAPRLRKACVPSRALNSLGAGPGGGEGPNRASQHWDVSGMELARPGGMERPPVDLRLTLSIAEARQAIERADQVLQRSREV